MPAADKDERFTTTAGVVVSCLGTVVGTGNVWRFPRISAQNSGSGGTLTFLIVWVMFLFLWSSPMLLIEYVIGRYYKKSPIQSFYRAMGDKFMWCGGWVTTVTFLISCYYSVILGWCLYYLGDSVYRSFTDTILLTEEENQEVFNALTLSNWPVLFNAVAVLLASACVIGGITWIEKVNLVLVPSLLCIIVFNFCWSAVQNFSDFGIRFLFSPEWSQITSPTMWVDAATQNAFDTGAAMGLIVPYATYMTRKNGVVRYSILIPALNNIVSLLCAITIFATVFSTLIANNPTLSKTGILEIMKKSGPSSTGLTFVWMPVLFGSLGLFGRILCPLFFLCLSFAGLSTVIADVEHTSLTLCDFGLPRKLATPLCATLMFLIGLPSAMNITILDNQDFIWGFALLPSGLMFQALVLKIGYTTFKEKLVNKFSLKDWKLTHAHMILIVVIAPIEAVALLLWWFYEEISITADNEPGTRWFDFGLETLMTVLVSWLGLIALLIVANVVLYHHRPKWMNYNPDEDDVSNDGEGSNHDNGAEMQQSQSKIEDGTGNINEAYSAL